jgi:hypothetical protein
MTAEDGTHLIYRQGSDRRLRQAQLGQFDGAVYIALCVEESHEDAYTPPVTVSRCVGDIPVLEGKKVGGNVLGNLVNRLVPSGKAEEAPC